MLEVTGKEASSLLSDLSDSFGTLVCWRYGLPGKLGRSGDVEGGVFLR